jgi:hypothetical protein
MRFSSYLTTAGLLEPAIRVGYQSDDVGADLGCEEQEANDNLWEVTSYPRFQRVYDTYQTL